MKLNARDWVFQACEDPSATTPVWATVGGLESFTLSNSEGEETVDTTDFDSAGIAESQAMQRGASCQLEGKIKRAANGTTPDAGQAACDTIATGLGEESLAGFRFRHTLDANWTVWTAWASKGDNGGGLNDKTTWAATFTRSGAASVVAVAP